MKKAVPLYENVDVYLNHSTPRAMENKIGILQGISHNDTGLWAESLILNPKHQEYAKIKWWAENFPGKLGLSHVADAVASGPAGNRVIEEIISVESVDLVPNPATVAGLHESTQDDAQIHLDKLIESNYTRSVELLFNPALDDTARKCGLAKLTENLLSQLKGKDMEIDWSKVTVEEIRKNAPTAVEAIVKEATEAATKAANEATAKPVADAAAAGAKIEKTVQEALAKVPTEARSTVFEEQVRAVAENAEKLAALVEDRVKVSKPVEALPGKNDKEVAADPAKFAESVRSLYTK